MFEWDLAAAEWRKSSLGGPEHNCVEVAFLDEGGVAVRNSKRPHAGVTIFTDGEWDAFVGGVKLGELDRG